VYEWSVASVTGLFNLKTKVWDTPLIRFFGFDRSKFPDLVQSHERVGGLRREAAAALGLLEGTPVFGGAGDAMTAAVGSGAVCEGEGHLCLGTSGFVGILTSKRVTGKRGIATIHSADPHKLFLIAETETAGACLKWAAKELYGAEADSVTFQHMDSEVAGAAPGSGGLIFTPWMYGERCPVADESVRAAFINLGANHTRSQMTRAIYEGVAYNARWILESIADLYGFRPDPLRVIGGGARGLPWLQIIADVTGRTLESAPNPQEASAVGAALIAAVGLGIYPSLEATKPLVPAGHVVTPDPAPRATYDELYAAYRQVYRSLRGLYHTLNRPKEQAGE
jgi:xylulokinase